MIINYKLNKDIGIKTLDDIRKLKPLIDNNDLKANKSRIARELGVDRRTVDKYLNGYARKTTRNRKSKLDDFYPLIDELLHDDNRIFAYRRVLWECLTDNHGLECGQSTFRRYIGRHPEFSGYFKRKSAVGQPSLVRFESDPGWQAQIDWKENMYFLMKNGESILINIFVLILSYSRFRVYRLSIQKSQDILLHFLDECFEIIGGVPGEILTDNMKAVMDEARTEYSPGKVNQKFQQFADDYGFMVKPCISGRPQTKAKVESPMKILDELQAYSGHLNYEELVNKLGEINDRENSRFHKDYAMIPVLGLSKEKDFLSKLPTSRIRSHYQINTATVKVNASSMVSYKSNQYSVPPEYIGQILKIQAYDDQLYIYSSTTIAAIHRINGTKLNYKESHYISLLRRTLPFDDEKIEQIAKENLTKIGERYKNGKQLPAADE